MTDRSFPIDFQTLAPDSRPRRWLVLPDGFAAAARPDQTSPVVAAGPEALLAAFEAAALSSPRVTRTRQGAGQVEFVQRSAVFRFPDTITAQAVAVEGGSALCAYSRAAIGHYDFRVNERRLKAWIEAAGALLAQAEGSAK